MIAVEFWRFSEGTRAKLKKNCGAAPCHIDDCWLNMLDDEAQGRVDAMLNTNLISKHLALS